MSASLPWESRYPSRATTCAAAIRVTRAWPAGREPRTESSLAALLAAAERALLDNPSLGQLIQAPLLSPAACTSWYDTNPDNKKQARRAGTGWDALPAPHWADTSAPIWRRYASSVRHWLGDIVWDYTRPIAALRNRWRRSRAKDVGTDQTDQ